MKSAMSLMTMAGISPLSRVYRIRSVTPVRQVAPLDIMCAFLDAIFLVKCSPAVHKHADRIVNNACRLTLGGLQACLASRRDNSATLGL